MSERKDGSGGRVTRVSRSLCMRVVDSDTILFVHNWCDPLTVVGAIAAILVALALCLMWPWRWTFGQLSGVAFLGYSSYFLATTLLNRSTLRLSRTELVVRHGPLPWPGNLAIALSDVLCVRCQKHKYSKGGRYRVEA